MGKSGNLLIVALAFFLASMAGVRAQPSFMFTGAPTTQPVGHYELCLRTPRECQQKAARHEPVQMTRRLWNLLIQVNNRVNGSLTALTDMEQWGVEEYWSYPSRVGDCEDYVLEKRRLLLEAGIPAGSLLITVVRQPNGDGHAVLTVNTSMGDFILDNLEPKILAWTETDYRFLKRQSTQNSGLWVSIDDGRSSAVGSVKAR